ncbi:hypothetical protein [Vibrio vulnificus]|uniref:hypothetical protein n=1 Tax=Vibrio vulnificus TaxID=672 RepID=UPI0019D43664|nr:hypothetical protein [Vibrio vulnificus]MBN8085914.1 hypothetical protein [Vibrio vulnificus]MBN8128889.1 hypothetical protein [Vibrio vulnificus]HAS6258261.1 hypothetical protein [Vibrio vulnificus]HDY8076671.1 hypothetical protein [Vibrio vulnificus]
MELTKPLTDIFMMRLDEARAKYGSLPFELVPSDVRDILIAGMMIDQAINEIERLNPHKESFTGELSPAIENMIEDVGLEITDVKHIILAAQAETKMSFVDEMREMAKNAAFNGEHQTSKDIDLATERLLSAES